MGRTLFRSPTAGGSRLLTLWKETYVSEQVLDSEARRVEHSVLATLS